MTGSSVEGDWKPLTVVAESGFSGGEDFLVEIVFASPKMLRMESVYEDMILERLVSVQMLYIYTSRSLGRRWGFGVYSYTQEIEISNYCRQSSENRPQKTKP